MAAPAPPATPVASTQDTISTSLKSAPADGSLVALSSRACVRLCYERIAPAVNDLELLAVKTAAARLVFSAAMKAQQKAAMQQAAVDIAVLGGKEAGLLW